MKSLQCIYSHWKELLCLLVPVICYHHGILLFGKIIQGGDFLYQFAPWREFALKEISTGHFPFWNPYLFSGTPFAANIQTSLFYPFNVLNLVFSPEYSFSLSLTIHHAMTLGFMYVFLIHLGTSRLGAVIGGLIYGWSGFFILHGHDGHLIHVRAYAWLPLVLYCQTLINKQFTFKPIFAMATVIALMFYAGHTQIPLYVFYLLLARALWWGLIRLKQQHTWWHSVQPLIGSLAGIGFSLILSALVLLPLLELSQHTAGRAGGADYEFGTTDSMPPSFLITMIAPYFYGSPVPPNREAQYWLSTTGYHEICGYAGVVSILLAFFAFLPKRKANTELTLDIYFFAILSVAGLFFALGKYNLLYPLLYYGLPGWDYFRVPGRLVLYFIIGISVCAAQGISLWQVSQWDDIKNSKAIKCAAVFSLMLLFCLITLFSAQNAIQTWIQEIEIDRTIESDPRWAEFPRDEIARRLPTILLDTRYQWMWQSMAMALLWIVMLWASLSATMKLKSSWRFYLTVMVVFMDLMFFSWIYFPTLPHQNWKDTYFPQTELVTFLQENATDCRVLCLDDAIGYPGLQSHPELRPNRLMHYGIQTVRGYDPLILNHYVQFVNHLFDLPEDSHQGGLLFFPHVPDHPEFEWLNVGYIVTTQVLSEPYKIVYSEPQSAMKVYENPRRKGWLWFDDPAISYTLRTIKPGHYEIEINQPEHITATTFTLSQSYYQGWHVRFDDQPALSNLQNSNQHPFLTWQVPPNTTSITIDYQPTSFIIGLWISLPGFLLGCLFIFLKR